MSFGDFSGSLEFSPERLEEIENRLAEISRLKRKYGGSVQTVLTHLKHSQERLEAIETAEVREKELRTRFEEVRLEYVKIAKDMFAKRRKTARKFEKSVEKSLQTVALEKSKFVVNFETLSKEDI